MRTRTGKRDFRWYRLDNAATIMPSTTRGPDTRCFRITCTLKEEVDPRILQEALDLVMEEFPHLKTVLRKGLFWYYFDETQQRALVEKDAGEICRALYVPGRRNLLFRVLYAGKSISLEMYHAIADGTGGLMVLKSLVIHYLCIRHAIPQEAVMGDDASAAQKSDDAFARYYRRDTDPEVHNYGEDARKREAKEEQEETAGGRGSQWKKLAFSRAYQIPMEKDFSLQCHYLEGILSASRVKKLAEENGATIGVYVTSIFIQSIIENMQAGDAKHPIVISVPVNLRQYFPSSTSRNFFGVITVSFHPRGYDGSLASILRSVDASFRKQLTREQITRTMNGYSGLVHNLAIQAVPLFLKDIAISRITLLTGQGTTATVSNLGCVTLPGETAGYVDRFSAFMTPPRLQMCISTYGDRMVFGVVTAYDEKNVMPAFFRKLSSAGIDVEIGSSDFDETP